MMKNFIKKLIIIAAFVFCYINPLVAGFRTDIVPQLYTLQGLFAFDATTYEDDLVYSLNTIPDLDLPANKVVRLQPLVGNRWQNTVLNNGTKLILSPQLTPSEIKWTADEAATILSSVPYVVIERENDFITIYLYSSKNRLGNKLVFNISLFEDFMTKTNWYQYISSGAGTSQARNTAYAWNIGFEFDAEGLDFESKLLGQQGINAFDIELQYKNNSYASAQFLAARKGNTNDVIPGKWNANLLFDNNIVYKKAMSTNDIVRVEKILTDAGIKLN